MEFCTACDGKPKRNVTIYRRGKPAEVQTHYCLVCRGGFLITPPRQTHQRRNAKPATKHHNSFDRLAAFLTAIDARVSVIDLPAGWTMKMIQGKR